MTNREKAITASSLNIVAAIWLLISSSFAGVQGTSMASNLFTVGIIVGIIALIRVFTATSTGWLSWINAALGVWLVISPFLLRITTTAMVWNSILLGIIIAGLGYWSAESARRLQTGV